MTYPLFTKASRTDFPYEQVLDEEAVVGRATSASYAPHEPAGLERFKADLRAAFARFQKDGYVILRYQTSVYTAAAA
jgi:hypothetical protein